MGCACIVKEKSIVAKDLDLIPEIDICIKEAKEVLEDNYKTKLSEDLSTSTKTRKKSKKRHPKSSKNLSFPKEFENQNKQDGPFISGPIITLLKKTIDEYNEKKNKSKKKIIN